MLTINLKAWSKHYKYIPIFTRIRRYNIDIFTKDKKYALIKTIMYLKVSNFIYNPIWFRALKSTHLYQSDGEGSWYGSSHVKIWKDYIKKYLTGKNLHLFSQTEHVIKPSAFNLHSRQWSVPRDLKQNRKHHFYKLTTHL